MEESRRYTAGCGLYCKDCIPSRHSFFDAAVDLAARMDEMGFDRYAVLKSERDDAFIGYGQFRRYLSSIASLRCSAPCSEGGGKKDCTVRACAREKGYAGCWECAGFGTCPKLRAFAAFHGDTPRTNLMLIREYGIDRWASHRAPHYPWSKRSS